MDDVKKIDLLAVIREIGKIIVKLGFIILLALLIVFGDSKKFTTVAFILSFCILFRFLAKMWEMDS